MRKLSGAEAGLVDRLNNVLLSNSPTPEELLITLELTPEEILERFPDRVYDLREKIVDQHIIFGDSADDEDTDTDWSEEESEEEQGGPPFGPRDYGSD